MATTTPGVETVTINDRQYRAVKEGLASILAPYRVPNGSNTTIKGKQQQQKIKPHNNDEGDQAVFYNPIQQYNRDVSVLAILTYGEGAVLEKKARWEKKSKVREKGKKGKQSQAATALVENEVSRVSETGVVRKRKADELETDRPTDQAGSKKIRVDDGEAADDDGLEVRELGDHGTSETTEHSTEAGSKADRTQDSENRTDESATKEKEVSFTILDALSASGLRAIRYAKEIPFATNIIANDLSPEAVKSIELNIDHNKVTGRVHSNVGDARAYMYSKVGNESQHPTESYVHRFDVIDLDPYGTAAPFFDSSLQALTDGGLLCVTCTDAGVFASNGYPEKAYSLYSGITMKGPYSHEAGLRLILHAIATSAAKYSIAIEPLLSLSIDFYARLFIRVHKKPAEVKLLAGTTMLTYNCDNGCGAWNTQLLARNQTKVDKVGGEFHKHSFAQGPSTTPLCEHCGSKMHIGGPMWAGPMHNTHFIQRILDKLPGLDTSTYGTTNRIKGMLTLALEEDLTLVTSNINNSGKSATATTTTTINSNHPPVPDRAIIPRLPPSLIDSAPFFFIPNYLAKTLHCSTPGEDHLRGAIRSLGYRVTRSHCKPGSFKTNAPWSILWEIMREWVRTMSPVKEGHLKPGQPGWRIMLKTRGSDTQTVTAIEDEIRTALVAKGDGTGERAHLRRLLESALYRLDHPSVVTNSTEDSKPTPTTTTTIQQNQNAADNTTIITDPPQNPNPNPNPLGSVDDVSKLKIVFDTNLGKERPRDGLVRYQTNPRSNWGPMSRAGGGPSV